MKNWKTSLTGVLTATVALLTFYSVIPTEAGALFVTLGVSLFSLFVKDNDVTGV